jgi:TATA-box binding protein (TBP) (component of TFIID and TFIIIB)
MMIESKIANVVATANLHQRLDPEDLASSGHVSHDTPAYGGRAGYIRSPLIRGDVILFRSGKMISVGAESESEAVRQLESAHGYLFKNKSIHSVTLRPKIVNIVATADFEAGIDLEFLSPERDFDFEPDSRVCIR